MFIRESRYPAELSAFSLIISLSHLIILMVSREVKNQLAYFSLDKQKK